MRLLPIAALAAILAPAQTVTYTYDAAGRVASAAYASGKTATFFYDAAGNLLRRSVSTPAAGAAPVLTVAGVVNAASFIGGPVSPGEIVTFFGTGIGPAKLAGLTLSLPTFVDTLISDTTILFDGIPAPLIYASSGQTSAIVPYSVAGKTATQVVAIYQGRRSAPISLPVASAAPALFAADSTGKGPGAILNQDTSINSAANPAAKGSVIVLYGTGEGQTTPGGIDGRIATAVYPKPGLSVKVSIGGVDATVQYAGAAPYLVAGVLQVNATVPDSVGSGPQPVAVTVGNASSPAGITVAVQ